MKRLHVIAGLFAALACSGLQAETIMKADIPFDFQLGKTAMPAGEYQITYSPGVLTVEGKDGQHKATVLTQRETREVRGKGVLEFHRYGDVYFFAGVWAPNSTEGGGIGKTSREKALARSAALQPTAVPLGSR